MLSRSRKAFTLLELIVVIVILGILAALAIPTFAAVIAKSRLATAKTTAASVGRDAVALGAFDQKGGYDVDTNATTAGQSYLDEAAAEASGVTVITEATSTNGYKAVLQVVQGGATTSVTVTFSGGVNSSVSVS